MTLTLASTPHGSYPTARDDEQSSTAPTKSRLRLTRRGRVVLVVAALLVIAAGLSAGRANAGSPPAPHQKITVEAGDTLWDVARQVAPQRDPRDTVVELMRVNNLDSPLVREGMTLQVPIAP